MKSSHVTDIRDFRMTAARMDINSTLLILSVANSKFSQRTTINEKEGAEPEEIKKKCNLTLAVSPPLDMAYTKDIQANSWVCKLILSEIWIYYPVTDRQTDRRTESDAYEPTVQYAQVGSKMETLLQVKKKRSL